MDLSLVRFLALHLAPAITAAARPGATFAVVQGIGALLVWTGHATIPDGMGWLVSPAAVIFGLLFAGMESLARHDPDFEELLIDLHLDRVTGAFGALAAPLLFASLGLPEGEAMGLATGTAAASADPISSALAVAVATDRPPVVTAAAVGGALGINLLLTRVRAEVLEFLRSFELSQMWLRIESGGVWVGLVLMPLLPMVVLGLMGLFSVVLGGVAWSVRRVRLALDQQDRTPCPQCGHAVRPEASLCPSCRASVPPTRLLDQPGSLARGWGAAMQALRDRRRLDPV